MGRLILLLGGNEGDVVSTFKQVCMDLELVLGSILSSSGYYESPAWGFESGQNFVNQVLDIKCDKSPLEVLAITQQIEFKYGRVEKTIGIYSSRKIDIDILFYDDQIIREELLTIPHPRLHLRKFTLLPLMEKWGDYVHPVFNKTVVQLFKECTDDNWVKPMP